MQAIRLLVCVAILLSVALSSPMPAPRGVRFAELGAPGIRAKDDGTNSSRGLGAIAPLLSNCKYLRNPHIGAHPNRDQQLDEFLLRGELVSDASDCPEMRAYSIEAPGAESGLGHQALPAFTQLPIQFQVAHGAWSSGISFSKLRPAAQADTELPEVQVVPEPPPMILVGLLLLAAGYLRKNAASSFSRVKLR